MNQEFFPAFLFSKIYRIIIIVKQKKRKIVFFLYKIDEWLLYHFYRFIDLYMLMELED